MIEFGFDPIAKTVVLPSGWTLKVIFAEPATAVVVDFADQLVIVPPGWKAA